VSSADFQAILTPEQIRVSQIVQAALALGVVFFGVVVVYLYTAIAPGPADEAPTALQTVQILSFGHAGLAIVLYVTVPMLENIVFSAKRFETIRARSNAPSPADACLELIRTASIIRLALYEAVAFFGLVVCILAATTQVLHTYPIYWLNMSTAVFLVVYSLTTFPNRDRLLTVFHRRFTAVS
jgi:hypothetical protein